MNVGEQYVKELLTREAGSEFLAYEQFQEIKKITTIPELKKQLCKYRYFEYDSSENMSDIVDQSLIPDQRQVHFDRYKFCMLTLMFALVAVVIYLTTKKVVVVGVVLPFFLYFGYKKAVRSSVKNKKYLSQMVICMFSLQTILCSMAMGDEFDEYGLRVDYQNLSIGV